MAALEQVLGAVLSSIVQARKMSDAYSAELCKQYLQDDFLRHLEFSVPRAVISSMKVDLKFAIRSTGSPRIDESTLGATAAFIVGNAVQAVAAALHDANLPPLTPAQRQGMEDSAKQALKQRLRTHDVELNDNGSLKDRDGLLKAITDILTTSVFSDPAVRDALPDSVLNPVRLRVLAANTGFVDALPRQALADLDVVVDTTSLGGLKPESISSLSFDLGVQEQHLTHEQDSQADGGKAAPKATLGPPQLAGVTVVRG